ncbi:MAG: hypothetical protein AAGD25_35210 [Cyanobacteria bacterium P01_F01_bin.150]
MMIGFNGESSLEADLVEALTQTEGAQQIFTPLITQDVRQVVQQIFNCSASPILLVNAVRNGG